MSSPSDINYFENMVREKETLEEALKFCQLTKRPKKLEEGDDKMLLKALVRCAKVDGTFAYAVGEFDYKGNLTIIKTFGTAAAIIKTLEVYPYEWIKKMFQAKFKDTPNAWEEKMDYIKRIGCPQRYLPTTINEDNIDEVLWLVAKYRQENDIRVY